MGRIRSTAVIGPLLTVLLGCPQQNGHSRRKQQDCRLQAAGEPCGVCGVEVEHGSFCIILYSAHFRYYTRASPACTTLSREVVALVAGRASASALTWR